MNNTTNTQKVRREYRYNENQHEQKPGSNLPVLHSVIEAYLLRIRQIPSLSSADKKRLAMKYRNTGDPKTAYSLVAANLRLVVKIAHEYYRRWTLSIMDLIQEGNLGLIQAVKKYDPYKEVKFSFYASFWIKAYIMRYIIDNLRLVKVGTTRDQIKLFYNLRREQGRLEKMGIYPAPELLAETFDTSEKTIVEMQQRLGESEFSLDEPVGDGWNETNGDFISGDKKPFDDEVAEAELKQILRQKLDDLKKSFDERERFILDCRILSDSPLTLKSIGDEYGITKERVRQIEKKLKKRISTYCLNENHHLSRKLRDLRPANSVLSDCMGTNEEGNYRRCNAG
jgi:RNA polymerase sigma-32 factor